MVVEDLKSGSAKSSVKGPLKEQGLLLWLTKSGGATPTLTGVYLKGSIESNKYILIRAVARSENPGGLVVMGRCNVLPG